ncbi:MAG: hypothetical protein K5784_08945 [Clostridiales bacterium]|nr:hypothetical protein [Clostridiales bacterium]
MVKHNGVMYGYTDSNLKDKLTVFDNATYTYDSIGNLTNDGWWTYTWEAGRQLKKLSHGTGADLAEIEFTYNHAGIRTKKVKKLGGTVTGTTEYILNGDKVVEQIFTDHVQNTVDVLHFYYDAQGKPAMVKHGSNMYGYVYNLQGDVLGLLDNSGSAVAEYGYDAYRLCVSGLDTIISNGKTKSNYENYCKAYKKAIDYNETVRNNLECIEEMFS